MGNWKEEMIKILGNIKVKNTSKDRSRLQSTLQPQTVFADQPLFESQQQENTSKIELLRNAIR
jgi:hypothetical protein